MDPIVIEEISQMIRKSRQKIEAARHCLAAGDIEDAVSRAYYAVFHAAKSALLIAGINVYTHDGLKQMFGLHLVKNNLIEKEFGKILNSLKEDGENGDYDLITYFDEEEVRDSIEKADRFIKRILLFLKERGIETEDIL